MTISTLNITTIITDLAPELEQPVCCWLGFGSYFHQPYRGHADIDLLGVTKQPCRQKIMKQAAGETLEISLIGAVELRQMLENRHPVYVPVFVEGCFLLGDLEEFHQFQQFALGQYQQGPLNLRNPAVLAGLRNRIRTIWQDLLDLRQQPELFTLCLAELAEQLIIYCCGQHKIWRRGRKYALQDLARAAPDIALHLTKALGADTLDQQIQLIRQMMSVVLSDAGFRLDEHESIKLLGNSRYG